MNVTFKNISNKTTKLTVDHNDTLESVVPKLMEQNSIDPSKNNLRFIFKGKVLNQSTTTFSDFKDESNLVIIYMVSKNKSETSYTKPNSSETTQQTTSQHTSQPTSQHTSQPTSQPQQTAPSNHTQPSNYESYEGLGSNWYDEYSSGENLDEVDRLRASVIAALFFIRQSPQFTELFMNNFQTLLSVLSSPQLRPLFERMYNDTELNDNEYIDNLTDHVSDVQNSTQASTQANIQASTQANTQANAQSYQTNSSGQPVMSIELNDDDKKNIDTLVLLGFNRNASIQAYFLSNKNVEIAASMLMDN